MNVTAILWPYGFDLTNLFSQIFNPGRKFLRNVCVRAKFSAFVHFVYKSIVSTYRNCYLTPIITD